MNATFVPVAATMRTIGRALLLGAIVTVRAPAQEREFCQPAEANCSENILAVRFGDPRERRSRLVIADPSRDTFQARVTVDNFEERMTHWSFGLQHDPDLLEIVEVQVPGSLPPAYEFFAYAWPAFGDPAPGVVCAVAVALFWPPEAVLPIGPDQPLLEITYRRRTQDDLSTTLRFAEDLLPHEQSPPNNIWVSSESRSLRPHLLVDGEVVVCAGCPEHLHFRRGDLDASDSLEITDAILALQALFLDRPAPIDCDAARDFNADGRVDVSDPLASLAWLFLSAPDPPEPITACGSLLESGSELGCVRSTCLPPPPF